MATRTKALRTRLDRLRRQVASPGIKILSGIEILSGMPPEAPGRHGAAGSVAIKRSTARVDASVSGVKSEAAGDR